ncbi:hypothetical protein OESDEN_11142 [Oesophagostomum dentatum]|uniref:Uncharacterized protein n=1 Tax=Oesophagostomum dentatum TaxID=61180 RepID=A0A0B1SZW0_OESDE|nr:hypothetical protein OESDEN_11142 [Oesophagostomum dentatum]
MSAICARNLSRNFSASEFSPPSADSPFSLGGYSSLTDSLSSIPYPSASSQDFYGNEEDFSQDELTPAEPQKTSVPLVRRFSESLKLPKRTQDGSFSEFAEFSD